MRKYDVINHLHENFLFAVIRGETAEDGLKISKGAYDGGIKNIEVTFSTPNIQYVISKLIKQTSNRDDVVIGAGSVFDVTSARIAILSGAQFIVSPTLVEDIAKLCNFYDIPYVPGCATPTEIQKALELGCNVIKVFPGNVLSSGFIGAIQGPMPQVNMMPTGGVNIDNLQDWISKGAWAVGIGGSLVSDYKEKGESSVKRKAEQFSDRFAKIMS